MWHLLNMAYEKQEASEKLAIGDEEYDAIVGGLVGDAIDYIDAEVAPLREEAVDRYRGEPLGDEEEGRSQIVMTELRDTVLSILPKLLRTFTGSERVVEFSPRTEADIEKADQATDWVDFVFYTQNKGFKVLWDGFKNALREKTGILHWYLDETERTEELDYSGITEEELKILESDEEIEILSSESDEIPSVDPEMAAAGFAPEQTLTVRVRRTVTDKKIKVECLPPEDFFISRDARDEDDARCVGHRRLMSVSDLVAMGYDEEEIRENMGADGYELNTERSNRVPTIDLRRGGEEDESTEEVTFFEAIVRVDRDGDGIAELRKVCGINPGDNCYILHDELWGDIAPYAVLCPDPEPHTVIGDSLDDQLGDLQEVKTRVVRNTLDSLANAIHPRTVIVEGQVNLDDALNTEVGAVVRARQPGMIQELEKPFVGQQSLPLLAYLDDTKARRTGTTDGPNAGQADALQSTTKDAVTATVAASDERTEMIARIFAETALARMYRGILRLSVRHIDKPQMLRLRKRWVPVDPRSWDADYDVICNIGQGIGNKAERAGFYNMLAGRIENYIQIAGPSNPIAGPVELRNALAAWCEASGVRDVSKFFKFVDQAVLDQQAAAAAAQPPQDGAALLAQVEMMKAQVAKEKADNEHLRGMLKITQDADIRRDKIVTDAHLKTMEIEAKTGAHLQTEGMYADMERQRNDVELTVNTLTQQANAAADRQHAAQQAEADRQHQAALAAQQARTQGAMA
jgi:hypothetical protein